MTDSNDPVIFEDSSGNEISNDPRVWARKQLAADGVDVKSMEEELAELRAFKAANSPATPPQDPAFADDAALGDDDDNTDDDEYAALNGGELKAKAKEEGLDIKGLKTVGDVRKAFRDRDAAASNAS